jgi:hypothetical protein
LNVLQDPLVKQEIISYYKDVMANMKYHSRCIPFRFSYFSFPTASKNHELINKKTVNIIMFKALNTGLKHYISFYI